MLVTIGDRVVAIQPLDADILQVLRHRGMRCPSSYPVDDLVRHFGANPESALERGPIDGAMWVLAGAAGGVSSLDGESALVRLTGTGICLTPVGAAVAEELAKGAQRDYPSD